MTLQKPHWPTWVTVMLSVLALLFVYHVVVRKR